METAAEFQRHFIGKILKKSRQYNKKMSGMQ
jgi:hypothetical protein